MRLDSTRVALVSCSDYEEITLSRQIGQVIACLQNMGDLQASRVLLKPNLITASHGVLPCTQPEFIVAVAKWFVRQGAIVRIGDAPVFGTAHSALTRLGITRDLAELGVEITDFSRVSPLLANGMVNPGLAADALECDLLVNLPRVKAHAQTRVTMAVKNYFGCLVGLRKPWWHMAHGGTAAGFADRLISLLELLPDSLTLLDGITAMSRSGPVHGEPYSLGVLAACHNPVAIDRAMHAIIRLDPRDSPLMLACQRHRFIGANLPDLVFPLSSPLELSTDDFKVPQTLNPVRFNPCRFVRSTCKRILLRYLPW